MRANSQAERRLRFLTQQISAQGISLRPYEETLALLSGRSGPQALEELDSRLSESEQRVQSMNNSYENLEKRALELEEARQVLRETDIFFNEAKNRSGEIRGSFDGGRSDDMDTPLLGDVEGNIAAHQAAGESGNYGGFELEWVQTLSISTPPRLIGESMNFTDSLPVLSIVREWVLSNEYSGEYSVVTSTWTSVESLSPSLSPRAESDGVPSCILTVRRNRWFDFTCSYFRSWISSWRRREEVEEERLYHFRSRTRFTRQDSKDRWMYVKPLYASLSSNVFGLMRGSFVVQLWELLSSLSIRPPKSERRNFEK